jgi:hypothetical protein
MKSPTLPTPTNPNTWQEHQQWENNWWGDCINTFAEETKQITYAHRMGLVNQPDWGHWPRYDLQGKSILDLGGGPASMLLKTVNGDRLTVVDPGNYPTWCMERYAVAGIDYLRREAEGFVAAAPFDECWIYNCLQHTIDPEEVVAVARKSARVVRLFEWVFIPPCPGHPHELRPELLNAWLGTTGTVEQMNENGCNGRAYYARPQAPL